MEVLPLGYHKARVVFTCQGIIDEMGFGLAFEPFSDGNVAQEAASGLYNALFTSTLFLIPDMGNSWTWDRVEDTQMLSDGPFTYIHEVGNTGTSSGETLPPNCAMLVRKITNLGGRTNRGRFYLPPCRLKDADVGNSGVISTAQVLAVNADLNTFFTALGTEGLAPVLLHSDPAETPSAISGFQLQSVIATQRRRLR